MSGASAHAVAGAMEAGLVACQGPSRAEAGVRGEAVSPGWSGIPARPAQFAGVFGRHVPWVRILPLRTVLCSRETGPSKAGTFGLGSGTGRGATRHEGEQVLGRPEGPRSEAGGGGGSDRRRLPEGGEPAGNVREPAHEVRWHVAAGDAPAEGARGWERGAQGARRFAQPGSGDAPGCRAPKALRPARKQKLVEAIQVEWAVSERRACAPLCGKRSTIQYRSRPPEQAARSPHVEDLPEPRALWRAPLARAAATRGLDTEPQQNRARRRRVGDVAPAQDFKAPSQDGAPRGPLRGDRGERDMGDGLRPRRARHRPQAACSDNRRHRRALLTDAPR